MFPSDPDSLSLLTGSSLTSSMFSATGPVGHFVPHPQAGLAAPMRRFRFPPPSSTLNTILRLAARCSSTEVYLWRYRCRTYLRYYIFSHFKWRPLRPFFTKWEKEKKYFFLRIWTLLHVFSSCQNQRPTRHKPSDWHVPDTSVGVRSLLQPKWQEEVVSLLEIYDPN